MYGELKVALGGYLSYILIIICCTRRARHDGLAMYVNKGGTGVEHPSCRLINQFLSTLDEKGCKLLLLTWVKVPRQCCNAANKFGLHLKTR